MTLECGFNPRTHTGATTAWHPTGGSARFQSTHPYGCDPTPGGQHMQAFVSIHAPIRVRRVHRYSPAEVVGFNPRTHTGATMLNKDFSLSHMFQSTHPYGCDVMGSQPWRYRHVSIHAPIRVRPVKPLACTLTHSFNPRTHTGATRREKCSCRGQSGFNPRTHTGATSPVIAALSLQMVSIHAPIRVRRLSLDLQGHSLSCFNPRTHTGATGVYMAELMPLEVSIHAPIRVRRRLYLQRGPDRRVSIHAPIRVRRDVADFPELPCVSIHAPIRVRRDPHRCSHRFPCFNPRTHTGAT